MEKEDIENKNECDCCGSEENLEEQDKKQEEIKEDDEKVKEEVDETNESEEYEKMRHEKAALKDENEKLKNELDTIKDRLLRTVAEYENFRKRTAKEKEGIYTDACEDVLKEVIPVLDNLERASLAEGDVDDLKKGIDMVVKGFKDSLSKLGIEEIDSTGTFDPNLHNAVMHEENTELGENVISEVFLKGYKRGDKVIRHSMVKVAN